MLGSSTSEQGDRFFDEKVWKAVKVFQKIMKYSAQLMSITPAFADKWNLKVWKDFEQSNFEALEICKKLWKNYFSLIFDHTVFYFRNFASIHIFCLTHY